METMADFFAARVDGYDEHMLTNVEGCKEAYAQMAQLVPANCRKLLDLGCGTGLELEPIFALQPDIFVTGIDLSSAMLARLGEKFGGKQLDLRLGSYFDLPFPQGIDCAISFETMHHFSHEKKTALYAKIHEALLPGGIYIECDYMVQDQREEDEYFAQYARLCKELSLDENTFYHFDTPCTIQNQLSMFQKAGFARAEAVFRLGNTSIIVASK